MANVTNYRRARLASVRALPSHELAKIAATGTDRHRVIALRELRRRQRMVGR